MFPLADELLLSCLSYLPLFEPISCACLCKTWHYAITSSPLSQRILQDHRRPESIVFVKAVVFPGRKELGKPGIANFVVMKQIFFLKEDCFVALSKVNWALEDGCVYLLFYRQNAFMEKISHKLPRNLQLREGYTATFDPLTNRLALIIDDRLHLYRVSAWKPAVLLLQDVKLAVPDPNPMHSIEHSIQHHLPFLFRGHQLITYVGERYYGLFELDKVDKVEKDAALSISCSLIRSPGVLHGWLQDKNELVCLISERSGRKCVQRLAVFNLATHTFRERLVPCLADQNEISALHTNSSNVVFVQYQHTYRIDSIHVGNNERNTLFPINIICQEEKRPFFCTFHWIAPRTFICFAHQRYFTDLYCGIQFDIYELKCKAIGKNSPAKSLC